jgi:hypothetical protein
MTQLLGIFGFVLVLLRAAILCSQTIATGGILFLVLVARKRETGNENWKEACWRLIRGSAAALAIAQLFFVITNSLVLTHSTQVPGDGGGLGGVRAWFAKRAECADAAAGGSDANGIGDDQPFGFADGASRASGQPHGCALSGDRQLDWRSAVFADDIETA